MHKSNFCRRTGARALLATPYHCKCGRSLEYYDSESVFPEISLLPSQRPPMGGSKMTLFSCSDFTKTLPQRRGPCPELKSAKKFGVRAPLFEGRAVEKFFSTLNISKTGGAIFAKFSAVAGIDGLYLRFGPEVGGGSNFGGSGGQSCQKWHVGSRVGRFRRLPEFVRCRNF